MYVLKRDLKLKIDDFGSKKKLNQDVREYHRLLFDYLGRLGQISVIHTRDSFAPIPWRLT
jgi:hypothetical protein